MPSIELNMQHPNIAGALREIVENHPDLFKTPKYHDGGPVGTIVKAGEVENRVFVQADPRTAKRIAKKFLNVAWNRPGYPRYIDMLNRPAHVLHAEMARLPSTLGVERGDTLKLADGTMCKVCRYDWHERLFICTTGTRTIFVDEEALLSDVKHYDRNGVCVRHTFQELPF